MFKFQFISLVPLLTTLAIPALAVDVTDLQVDFQTQAVDDYIISELNSNFPGASNDAGSRIGFGAYNGDPQSRSSIVEFGTSSRLLKVKYPQGSVGLNGYETNGVPNGNGGGAQFNKPLTGRDEYYLEYRVKFLPGFEWGATGGKLPGLAGGTRPAGGDYSSDGFSARFMWHPAEPTSSNVIARSPHLNLYLYWAEQKSHLTDPTGPQYAEGEPVTTLAVDTSYTIRQRVKLNTPGTPNGLIQVWVNRPVTDPPTFTKSNIKFRYSSGTFKIDDLFFCTFYGGNQSTDGPSKDTYAVFDDFKVWHPSTTTSATTSSAGGS